MMDLTQELTTGMKDWNAFQALSVFFFFSGKLMSFVRQETGNFHSLRKNWSRDTMEDSFSTKTCWEEACTSLAECF